MSDDTNPGAVVCDLPAVREVYVPPLRFLHGDDNNTFSEEVAKYLKENFNAEGLKESAKAGGKPVRVTDVEHLLLYASTGGFDFYITDGHFERGVFAGIDFISLLREMNTSTPVILLTGGASTDVRERVGRHNLAYTVQKGDWAELSRTLSKECGFPVIDRR